MGLDVSSARKPMRRNHGQEMGQGGETNGELREIWQVDLEASQCTLVRRTGSMGAESLWYSGRGCAANVDQASEDDGS